MTSVDALRDAVPGVDVDAAVAAAGTEGGRVQLELLMESLEIAAAQLLTVPGVAVEEPAELRRRLFERGQDLVDRKSTRLNSSHVAHLVCRHLPEKNILQVLKPV